MTLRGRLTTAFLVVVLGPVLLGSIFVAMTVATVSRDRAAERLDHAAATVRTGMAATCRQLQAAADAVALVPAATRQDVVGQFIARGLATDIRIELANTPRKQRRVTARETKPASQKAAKKAKPKPVAARPAKKTKNKRRSN